MAEENTAPSVCLVTGATRGIGAAIADQLGLSGQTIIGTATSEAGAQTISDRFASQSIKGIGRVLDVSDLDQITGLVKSISDEYGPITTLVNNAGITRDGLMMRMKEEDWDAIMDTNLKSVFRLSKACLRGMSRARFGRIINIGSVVGSTGNAGQANYATAKAGLIGFSRSLAQEVASRNITVNVVAPGFIQTDMTSVLDDKTKEALNAQIPMKRMGLPAEIASAVSYLASAEAGYVTGTVMHVNGGMFMG